MKRVFISSTILLLSMTVFAQPGMNHDGPPKPPPVAERWKRDSIKLQLYVTMSSPQINNVKNAFISFYNSLDTLVDKNKTTTPPTPLSREAMENVHQTRNSALKNIFDAEQWERFETFEREFMPPPPPPMPPMNGEHKPPTNV